MENIIIKKTSKREKLLILVLLLMGLLLFSGCENDNKPSDDSNPSIDISRNTGIIGIDGGKITAAYGDN